MITKQEKHTMLQKVHTQVGLRDSNASTNLPARGPTLRTSPLAASLKCEHGTYEPPRSYPHMRVSRYEHLRSYHHVFITSHEPTRS